MTIQPNHDETAYLFQWVLLFDVSSLDIVDDGHDVAICSVWLDHAGDVVGDLCWLVVEFECSALAIEVELALAVLDEGVVAIWLE